MERLPRKRLDHVPPDWVRPEADFFITVCGDQRGANQFCNETMGPIIIESIRTRHDRGIWYCHMAMLMPDHIHLILNFPNEKTLARVVGEWKGWLGRHRGISWQRNFFDHRIRSEADRNKGDYILHNPVRAGFVQRTEDWPYQWMPS
jgi:putative transposase